jgi:ferredoxin
MKVRDQSLIRKESEDTYIFVCISFGEEIYCLTCGMEILKGNMEKKESMTYVLQQDDEEPTPKRGMLSKS